MKETLVCTTCGHHMTYPYKACPKCGGHPTPERRIKQKTPEE